MLNAIYAWNDEQNASERAERAERANIDPEAVRRDLIAYELTRSRINWKKVRALGGDAATIAAEARAHGDEALYRRCLRGIESARHARENGLD